MTYLQWITMMLKKGWKPPDLTEAQLEYKAMMERR